MDPRVKKKLWGPHLFFLLFSSLPFSQSRRPVVAKRGEAADEHGREGEAAGGRWGRGEAALASAPHLSCHPPRSTARMAYRQQHAHGPAP
jgi:hypothetical protein